MTTVAAAVAAFRRWRDVRPHRVEVLSGGLHNAMIRVDDWVVRFYLHDATACEREAICRSLADPTLPRPIVEELVGVVGGSLDDLRAPS